MTHPRAWRALAICAALLLGVGSLHSAEKTIKVDQASTIDRLRKDLGFLAADQCEGRGPGTKGIDLAADYIAKQFRSIGLKPLTQTGSYFQYFTINGATLKKEATLSLKGPQGQTIVLKQGVHFEPLGISHSGAYRNAEVVFGGYGIRSDNREFSYDSYADVNVDGKIVVLLRDTPRSSRANFPVTGRARQTMGSLTQKMDIAKKRGALAVLFVSDRDTAKDGDDLLGFNFLATSRSTVNLPALHLQRSMLDTMLKSSFTKSLTEIEDAIDRNLKPLSTPLTGWKASLAVNVDRGRISVKNVVAELPGAGPLAKETVVVGAHYDHLGYGGFSSLARLKKMAIHNGADDNASGTTSIIELARRFASIPNRQGRRIVFIAFSGEELGLLGSSYYVKNPLVSLKDTVGMVNLDMVGRLSPDKSTGLGKLQIHGTGTATSFDKLIDDLNKDYKFKLSKVKSGFGPSDHSSFYSKEIPVFFFFTGTHDNYHRPSDTIEKVNYEGMAKIINMAEEVTTHLTEVQERPKYVKLKPPPRRPGSRGPRLGFRPAYDSEKPGVILEVVLEGGNAARGGMKDGDRIVEMNGKKIKNIEDYMVFMSSQKIGNEIELGVIRKDKKLKLKLKLRE